LEAGKSEAGKSEAGKLDAGKLDAGKLGAGKLEAGKLEAGSALGLRHHGFNPRTSRWEPDFLGPTQQGGRDLKISVEEE
jgi:hypothetical protein